MKTSAGHDVFACIPEPQQVRERILKNRREHALLKRLFEFSRKVHDAEADPTEGASK